MASADKYDLEERLIDFAVKVVRLVEKLPKTVLGRHIGGQLIRSVTAPASNYGEAQGAESRPDFIHKMKICLKELRETKVWLLMIGKAELIRPLSNIESELTECDQLISIFVRSISTAKRNLSKGEASLQKRR